jgi:predicted permease
LSVRSRIVHWWRQLVHGRAADRDLDDELEAWVDLSTDERVGAGQRSAEARRAALLELGGLEQVKESVRDIRGTAFLDMLRQDVRYGVRQAVRAPAFSAAAIVALALGIGATAATFSVVDAVLIRPLGYADPERLAVVLHDRSAPASPANYFAWKARASSFASMEAAEYWTPNISDDGDPEKLYALHVTPGMFALLGVLPERGRTLTPGDEDSAEVVMSRGLWLRRFGGDPDIVGRAIRLDGEPYTVVGVMPAGFQFAPFWATQAELWAPLPLAARATGAGRSLRIFARLAPGVPIEAARDEMTAIAAELERREPGSNRNVTVTPLKDLAVGDVRSSLIVVFAAVGLVLIVACANVAHMLLARATAREKEVAVRAALGAGSRRLARQFLTESLLLSGAGGAAGLALAGLAISVIRTLAAHAVPRIDAVGLDVRVLAFAIGVSTLTGIVFGLAPMKRLSRPNLATALGDADRGSSAGRRTRRARGALMASEVALAVILLVGAGLTLRSFAGLRSVEPGWNPEPVLSMVVSVAGTSEASPGRRTAFYQQALDAVRALPGVRSAGAINHLPLAGDLWTLPFQIEGRPAPPPGDEPGAAYRVVLPGYFETMGLEVRRGRTFTGPETLDSPGAVVVNQFLAETHWPGENPIGKRLAVAGGDWLTVVGVVENAFLSAWAAPPSEELYIAYLQARRYREGEGPHVGYMTVVVRAEGDPAPIRPMARAAVRAIAPDVPVSDVLLMRDVVGTATSGSRFLLSLLGAFAVVALVLAAVGIYGVISYDVAGRRREIGIRLAMGAAPRQVLVSVVGRGMALVGAGAAAGLTGAFALSGLLAGVLFGVTPTDAVVFTVVPVVLGTVGLAACLVPAWRASRVDPVRELRA